MLKKIVYSLFFIYGYKQKLTCMPDNFSTGEFFTLMHFFSVYYTRETEVRNSDILAIFIIHFFCLPACSADHLSAHRSEAPVKAQSARSTLLSEKEFYFETETPQFLHK